MNSEDEDTPPPPPPQEDGPPTPPAPEELDNQPPVTSLLDQIRNPKLKLRKVGPSENKADPVAKTADNANKPLTIAEEMQQRMLRRQAAISGKQDQMEQRREREKASAKPVTVLTAKEMTTPAQPPPPPPPSDGGQQYGKLPTLAMSDDGSDDGPGRFGDDDKSTDGDDFLAQIRNIKKKQDEGGLTAAATSKQPPSLSKTEEIKNPVANFESQMVGLRNRDDSLSLSEASDWSDD
ncbi:hypothetical protein DD238_008086 [Peronospora effusa]|uniref:WH2 domain-containing protein n=1 Tax=Peronospora effusa TaxID=542832 RepID=A0A3M6V756_9STRA|nr:hypothetical protein DD238_008086 [Peronospora effusa]RQM11759.1 hypothetical protein DD237_008170 [Peronospora effusa]